MTHNTGNYWDNYKQNKSRYTLTFTEEENKFLLSDLDLMKKYTQNFNLRIKDVLKKKGLSSQLLASDELEAEKRRLDMIAGNQRLMKKALEIFVKTTSNINQIARDINIERLENPNTALLKEWQWEELLKQMGVFKEQYLGLGKQLEKMININDNKKK